jgi:hypothetical protein
MRPNRKEPESALFWFQSLYHCCDPHYSFRHVGRMAASHNSKSRARLVPTLIGRLSGKRVLQLRYQVIYIFNTDRQANQRVADTQAFPTLQRY